MPRLPNCYQYFYAIHTFFHIEPPYLQLTPNFGNAYTIIIKQSRLLDNYLKTSIKDVFPEGCSDNFTVKYVDKSLEEHLNLKIVKLQRVLIITL